MPADRDVPPHNSYSISSSSSSTKTTNNAKFTNPNPYATSGSSISIHSGSGSGSGSGTNNPYATSASSMNNISFNNSTTSFGAPLVSSISNNSNHGLPSNESASPYATTTDGPFPRRPSIVSSSSSASLSSTATLTRDRASDFKNVNPYSGYWQQQQQSASTSSSSLLGASGGNAASKSTNSSFEASTIVPPPPLFSSFQASEMPYASTGGQNSPTESPYVRIKQPRDFSSRGEYFHQSQQQQVPIDASLQQSGAGGSQSSTPPPPAIPRRKSRSRLETGGGKLAPPPLPLPLQTDTGSPESLRPAELGQLVKPASASLRNDNRHIKPAQQDFVYDSAHVQDVLKFVERDWNELMNQHDCNHVSVALELMDTSSVGRADEFDLFFELAGKVDLIVRGMAAENQDRLGSSSSDDDGGFRDVAAHVGQAESRVRQVRDRLAAAKRELTTRQARLRAVAEQADKYAIMLKLLDAVEVLQIRPDKLQSLPPQESLSSSSSVIGNNKKKYLTAEDLVREAQKLMHSGQFN
ncbi:Sec8 exocyst complex component-specific domain-containing protein [Lipomyces japonicus]|uniref:Sec8 exocyst complex component-specific domain-containing protein n=1 Tax=Lipomyces japonicus TaxID=56871 RepID=UPI0034CE1C17